MTSSTRPGAARRVWDDPRIIAPDEAAWARMAPAERDAAVDAILAVLDEYRESMSEGVRHYRAKSGAAADLDAHFRRAGRSVFVTCELAVLYPAEAVIVPDILAVVECDPDLDVESWRVADQGRGIDLVIEVRNKGKKHKDLVENVRDYARLQIPEYFSFDCRSMTLRAWRLGASGSKVYQPVLPQGGACASKVLGLDRGVVDGRLRFFVNSALVPSSVELVARLQAMADRSQQVAAESQQAAVESQQVADAAVDRAARAQASLVRAIVHLAERQGLVFTEHQRAVLVAEADTDRLARWLERCVGARGVDEVFADD
jgi:Uma2 family endonuclease